MLGPTDRALGMGRTSQHSPIVQTVREGVRGQERVLVYQLSEESLGAGSSLGNDKAWVTSKATGALDTLFSLDIGQKVMGSLVLRYSAPQKALLPYDYRPREGESGAGSLCQAGARVHLNQGRPGTFRIHPAYQERSFRLPGDLSVSERFLVPNTSEVDPPVAYQIVTLRNDATVPRSIHITAYANLRGTTPEDVVGRFDEDLGALVAWNDSHPEWVRVLGFSQPADSYMLTHDVSRAAHPLSAAQLTGDVSACGSVFGVVQCQVDLQPQESRKLAVVLVFTPKGQEEGAELLRKYRDFEPIVQATIRHYHSVLDTSRLETPDPIINQGVEWCKANMRRVLGTYPEARAFTNEPGVSSNVVIRDVAWFVHGSDWMDPGFSRDMLRTAARLRYPCGKIPEYFDALTGRTEDYGLNINDATPLFVLATAHHAFSAGSEGFLEELFPAVRDAVRYLLSQRNGRGLVCCRARGQNVWGIASWRNVIPDYSINGEVTELNALCYAALRKAASLAVRQDQMDLAQEWDREAEALRSAINEHLLNPDNGMYYLNVDLEGNCHTDVTSDEVFPVMFGVASDTVAFRIVSRLNSPDFWTEAGLRTVSDQSPFYDPSSQVGLMGGVWPGVVFWYAFAAARYHPEFMVRGLRDGYRNYLTDPRKNNTVPGQFSEWFDGESLVNRGMRLSPWEPPRYLWAAVEGLAGITAGPDGLSIDPKLPPDWKWLTLTRLPYQGREVSFFVGREGSALRVYATEEVRSPYPTTLCGADVTHEVEDWSNDASIVAFRSGDTLRVCVGNSASQTQVVPWGMHGLVDAGARYHVSVYNSEYGGWLDVGESRGKDLQGLAVSIEQSGFYVLCLKRLG